MEMPSVHVHSWERAKLIFGNDLVTCCPACGLPSLSVSTTKKPGLLSIWCGSCRMRTLTHARWAPWWLGQGRALERLGMHGVREHVRLLGLAASRSGLSWEPAKWETIRTSRGIERQRLQARLNCVTCGAQAAAVVLTTVHGLPYLRCIDGVCGQRTFVYRFQAVPRLYAVAATLNTDTGLGEWMSAFRTGRDELRQLLGGAGRGEEHRHAAVDVEPARAMEEV